MFKIQETDNTWKRYGLQEHLLNWNDKESNFKAITKGKNLVAVTSREYVLLPNEEAITIAEEVAADVGAVPFSDFKGEWFMKLDKHIIQTGRTGNQVHALYAWDNPVDIGGGDTIQLGFAIHNSIDRSMGFGAGLFTFRHACANMVFMGLKGQSMQFDERQTIAWMYKKHVGNFSPDKITLKTNIRKVLEQGYDVIQMYKKMKEIELQQELFEKLKSTLPKKYMPENLTIEPLKAEAPKTVWDGYNDITAAIWHNNKTDYQTKKILFDRLHKIVVKVVA